MSSNLIRLLLLPREHDDAMPPAGKAALTPEEVLDVVQWIQKGAPFPESEASVAAQGGNEAKSPTPNADIAKTETPKAAATGSATSSASTSPAQASNSTGKVDFAAQIQPIFEQTCVHCHGAEKQKGKLRLDSLAAALKGGDNGPSVVPGKAAESLLVKRLLINPAKDENEELMPPAKKGGPLEKSQIELVRRWIDEGAVWPKDVMLQAKAEAVK
jgi:mono/diheme cytochrome c family protein